MTVPSTNNVQIHNYRANWFFEDMPARPNSCTNLRGASTFITGTLTGGVWNGNSAGQHGIVLTNAPGLTGHPGNNTSIRLRGTITDSAQTLTVLPFP